MVKTVCIVGAGPSGLVAAKTLIHDHPKDPFEVTVLEKSHRIGGLWPVSKIDDGLVNPDMCTNQSRHTVSFSDLAWPETAPAFPKAWQVGEYLERYIKSYPGYEIRTNCKVLKTELEGGRWKVHVQVGGTVPQVLDFDHLIIATGFFGKPKMPKALERFQTPVWHSSQLRDVKDLLTNNGKSKPRPGRRIVVVGGQMSGVETAANIAFQISTAFASVGESIIAVAEQYFVSHIVQQPFWVMPLFFPRNPVVDVVINGQETQKKTNHSPNFLPLDLVAYSLASKPPGKILNTSGHITPEAAKITHDFMNTFIGTDQNELGSRYLVMNGEIRSEPPWLAVSDQYNEFVRSGKINTMRGKATCVSEKTLEGIDLRDGCENRTLEDIAAVVFATGFEAAPSINFLPEKVLEDLNFDPTSDKFPLALNVHCSTSREVPSLGFVGFYRSPYWGVMEMQARFLGKLWSGDTKAAEALVEDKTMGSMLMLRNNPRSAQFPMGDYAYLMESFSDILGIKRTEPKGTAEETRTGIVQPARYLYNTASAAQRQEAALALMILDRIFNDSASVAKYVPRAIFRAMQGDWQLERTIESRRADYPSGTLTGHAKFHPRAPTDSAFDMEHLYREHGEFVSGQGIRFTATRSYAYRYCEAKDQVSAWFVKPKDNKSVDYLFHDLEIILPEKASNPVGENPWRAKSSHLCIDDMYNVKYEFGFTGVSLDAWSQEYTVNGPAKDYTIRNVYRRPELKVGINGANL